MASVRELWRNRKHHVNWTKWRFLHNLFVQKCKPAKSDRESCCKITSEDLKKLSEDNYPNDAPKLVGDLSKLHNSSLLLRHQEKKEINFYAENIRFLDIPKELAPKGGSKAMYDLDQSRT